jgi:dTDP-4-amino-4,6-dideoxygalactose transaminase
MRIPITKPFFDDREKAAILEPLESGWVVQGPKVAEFERLFAEYAQVPFALATTSCTTALHLALVALGIGPGDEVIVPAFTFAATANVVEHQGAKPVFVDVDLCTFNIEVSQIEPRVTMRTKVIMPVSLFGVSADMHPILALAHSHGLHVVEDAACAIGAWYQGHHAGTLGTFGCVSFHPRKAITTGEGGMVLTHDKELADRIRSLRDHGASRSDLVRHGSKRSYLMPEYAIPGYNYRMTDLQGAVGVAQMAKLPYILERRTALAHRYDEALSELDWLQLPYTPGGYVHGYQSYVCLFQPERPSLHNVDRLHEQRNALMERLEERGIATRQGTQAVHVLSYYREKYHLKPADFPNAYLADQLTLALPLYPQMTDEELDYVVASLQEAGTQVVS